MQYYLTVAISLILIACPTLQAEDHVDNPDSASCEALLKNAVWNLENYVRVLHEIKRLDPTHPLTVTATRTDNGGTVQRALRNTFGENTRANPLNFVASVSSGRYIEGWSALLRHAGFMSGQAGWSKEIANRILQRVAALPSLAEKELTTSLFLKDPTGEILPIIQAESRALSKGSAFVTFVSGPNGYGSWHEFLKANGLADRLVIRRSWSKEGMIRVLQKYADHCRKNGLPLKSSVFENDLDGEAARLTKEEFGQDSDHVKMLRLAVSTGYFRSWEKFATAANIDLKESGAIHLRYSDRAFTAFAKALRAGGSTKALIREHFGLGATLESVMNKIKEKYGSRWQLLVKAGAVYPWEESELQLLIERLLREGLPVDREELLTSNSARARQIVQEISGQENVNDPIEAADDVAGSWESLVERALQAQGFASVAVSTANNLRFERDDIIWILRQAEKRYGSYILRSKTFGRDEHGHISELIHERTGYEGAHAQSLIAAAREDRCFGSWEQALREAGFVPEKISSAYADITLDDAARALRALYEQNPERSFATEEFRGDRTPESRAAIAGALGYELAPLTLYNFCIELFGDWHSALTAAGIPIRHRITNFWDIDDRLNKAIRFVVENFGLSTLRVSRMHQTRMNEEQTERLNTILNATDRRITTLNAIYQAGFNRGDWETSVTRAGYNYADVLDPVTRDRSLTYLQRMRAEGVQVESMRNVLVDTALTALLTREVFGEELKATTLRPRFTVLFKSWANFLHEAFPHETFNISARTRWNIGELFAVIRDIYAFNPRLLTGNSSHRLPEELTDRLFSRYGRSVPSISALGAIARRMNLKDWKNTLKLAGLGFMFETAPAVPADASGIAESLQRYLDEDALANLTTRYPAFIQTNNAEDLSALFVFFRNRLGAEDFIGELVEKYRWILVHYVRSDLVRTGNLLPSTSLSREQAIHFTLASMVAFKAHQIFVTAGLMHDEILDVEFQRWIKLWAENIEMLSAFDSTRLRSYLEELTDGASEARKQALRELIKQKPLLFILEALPQTP